MPKDESPVEKTASSGAPSESGASQPDAPKAERPTARRSRTPRPKPVPKVKEIEVTQAVDPVVISTGDVAPKVSPDPKSPAKRAPRPPRNPRTPRVTAVADTPILEVVAEPTPVAEVANEESREPAKRQSRAPRKVSPAKIAVEPIVLNLESVAAPETADDIPASESTPVQRPSRRSSRPPRRQSKPEIVSAEELADVGETETFEDAPPPVKGGPRPRRSRSPRKAPVVPNLPIADMPEEQLADITNSVEESTGPKPRRGRAPGRVPAPPRIPKVAPEPPEDLTVGARIIVNKGMPELHIHGVVHSPVFFFGNAEMAKDPKVVDSEIRKAAKQGIHLHSTLIELTCPMPPDDSVYEKLDARVQEVLNADPLGYVMPRLVFVPAPGWRKQYPNEVNRYSDGTTDDPSIASDHFWKEVETALTNIAERVGKMTYGQRVIGYHLERGEWFHPKDGGYDCSFANREAFRQWLRDKYSNNESALRAAWYDGNVQFYTVEIPPAPDAPRPEMAFFEPRKERNRIDFLEYTSEVTAQRIGSLAAAIKKATKNQALVSVCYGYTFEFGHTFSGHLALEKMLECKFIDIVSGPPSYSDRLAGGAASIPGPVHSAALHGKLYVSEDDTKTFLAPTGDSADDFNPRIDTLFNTDQVQERAIGRALASQTGIAFMDTWGEGWLDSDEMWDRIGNFRSTLDEYSKVRKPFEPDIVALIDEKSLIHVQRGDVYLKKLLQDQRDLLQRCGASVGFYLQSDVTEKTFPTSAKLYLFLSPYRVTPEQRAAIKDKLKGDGRILVWMYAVGICDARGEPEDSVTDLVGMTLRRQSWNAEVGSKFLDNRSPITDRLRGKDIGARERLNPSFYVDDESPAITALAEYSQTSLTSIAVRSLDNWHSIFCGEPILTDEFLAGLCNFAKVHRYIGQTDTYLTADGPWLTLVAPRDGQRIISMPITTGVYDISEGKLIGERLTEFRIFLRGKTTKRLLVGTLEEMRKYGISADSPPRERRIEPYGDSEPDLPIVVEAKTEVAANELPSTTLPEKEEQSHPRDPFLEFVDTLGEVDEIPLYGEEVETPGDGNSDGAELSEEELRRRRRRRGGRGRGRRRPRPGETGDVAPAAPATPSE